MQILCRTLFDITETKITGHFKSSQVPFNDAAGTKIIDLSSWTKSRNQQRNLETISQLLQLRTQIFDISVPVKQGNAWEFTFSIEFEGVYQDGTDEFGILKSDCNGVPMLVGLTEDHFLTSVLTIVGPQQNIWFETITVNN